MAGTRERDAKLLYIFLQGPLKILIRQSISAWCLSSTRTTEVLTW